MQAPTADELRGRALTTSKEVRATVAEARERQSARLAGTGVLTNAELTPELLRDRARIDVPALDLLHAAYMGGGLSARGYQRTLRVARTIADVAGSDRVRGEHVNAAVALRRRDAALAEAA